jgi:hypothetical protein
MKIDLRAPVFVIAAAAYGKRPARSSSPGRKPGRVGQSEDPQQEAAMRTFPAMIGFLVALMSLAPFLTVEAPTCAADMPDYFKQIVGTETASPIEVETTNILALNATMLDLYANAAQTFKKNILAQHPVILGLFSGSGGRFILYRPGMPPLEAPSVPIAYQLLKSVGHSALALSEVVVPYLGSPHDSTWRSALAAYGSRMQSALDNLEAAPLRDDWKAVSREILENNIAFTAEADVIHPIILRRRGQQVWHDTCLPASRGNGKGPPEAEIGYSSLSSVLPSICAQGVFAEERLCVGVRNVLRRGTPASRAAWTALGG